MISALRLSPALPLEEFLAGVPGEKYSFIDAEYADEAADAGSAPGVVQMCEWLGVS